MTCGGHTAHPQTLAYTQVYNQCFLCSPGWEGRGLHRHMWLGERSVLYVPTTPSSEDARPTPTRGHGTLNANKMSNGEEAMSTLSDFVHVIYIAQLIVSQTFSIIFNLQFLLMSVHIQPRSYNLT